MKLKLNNLKVHSFKTTLQEDKAKNIIGGVSEQPCGNTWGGCSTFCNTQFICTVQRRCSGQGSLGGLCGTVLCNDTV